MLFDNFDRALALILMFGDAAIIIILGILCFKLRSRFRYMDRQFEQLTNLLSQLFVDRFDRKLDEKALEIQYAAFLGQLNFKFPVFFGGWSIDAFLGKFLLSHLIKTEPRLILELGSGSSTLLIEKCMESLNRSNCEHIAVDHDEQYLKQTHEVLRLCGLEKGVVLWKCPLEHVEGARGIWYAGLVEKLNGRQVDLLLVDGPPGHLQMETRWPALPLIYPYLSEHCTVILDDANRPDEKNIAEKWVQQFPEFELTFLSEGHGIAVLSR